MFCGCLLLLGQEVQLFWWSCLSSDWGHLPRDKCRRPTMAYFIAWFGNCRKKKVWNFPCLAGRCFRVPVLAGVSEIPCPRKSGSRQLLQPAWGWMGLLRRQKSWRAFWYAWWSFLTVGCRCMRMSCRRRSLSGLWWKSCSNYSLGEW